MHLHFHSPQALKISGYTHILVEIEAYVCLWLTFQQLTTLSQLPIFEALINGDLLTIQLAQW